MSFLNFSSDYFGHYGWVVFCEEVQGCVFGFGLPFLLLQARKSTKGIIGILGSLVICTILYVLFAYVLTGLENYLNFKGDASL
jgi:APA family basic amino acid/polyamine antiporter